MYEKTPIIKKLKKKFIYSFTKVFFRIIDRFFNVTIEEIIKRKFLNLHSQKYNILENKCYFIHVPKTGGTTFHHHLQINLKKKSQMNSEISEKTFFGIMMSIIESK